MAINTVNELSTGKAHFTKLERKTAQATKDAMIKAVEKLGILTYTTDNGTEFTDHEQVTKDTRVPVYFADPYCSNQRGANENVTSAIAVPNTWCGKILAYISNLAT